MPVTLKEIAAAAGVSIGTVDRALHNRGRVNPQVAERIRTIAKQLNYHTNKVAQSLAIRSKNIKIAIVLHIAQNDFFDEVIQGIQKASNEIYDFGVTTEIFRCQDFDADDQLRQIDLAVNWGANAIVLVPIGDQKIVQRLQQLHEQEIPVVFLTALLQDAPCFSAVHCDYARSGRIGGQLLHLVSGGKGNVLAFSPSFSMLGHRQRMEAFVNYLAENCVNLYLIKVTELPNDSFDDYHITSEILKAYPQADCIIYCGSTRAGLKAIREAGRPIHSVFYDFTPATREGMLSGMIDASIVQTPLEQGYRSVMILFDYLISNIKPEEHILVENKIILRECMPEIR